jgi:G-protein alpha subunit
MTQLRTTGIVRSEFDIGRMRYLVTDVGGARSERGKWRNTFEGVNVVIFIAALSGYDSSPYYNPEGVRLYFHKSYLARPFNWLTSLFRIKCSRL